MDDYNSLMKVRLDKVEEMRQEGINPYANDFRTTHHAQDLRDACEPLDEETLAAHDTVYAIAGRVMAINSFGKAMFVRVKDKTGIIQAYLRKNLLGESFTWLKSLDVGDIVGVVGTMFRTRTGELTIQASEARVLTKAIRPLPEKFHGLTDIQTRYRQRYVDLVMNDEVREVFVTRSRIIKYVRHFFDGKGFMEVETPMMHTIPGGATARPFKTHHNALDIPLFLRIAPELYLKRLVVGGLERVFEINRSFRNEGIDQTHNPEFTMLEFYMAFATFEDLMDLTEELLRGLVETIHGTTTITHGEHELRFGEPFARVSIRQGLLDTGKVTEDDLGSREALAAKLEAHGIDEVPEEWGLGKCTMELFELLCEDSLVQPTFVTHFPTEVSPLSRRNDADPSVVDRFELYIGGNELANAFSELNDPVDQRERFEAQIAQKAEDTLDTGQVDTDYVRALEYGMPPTAGEGIGIDRLVMLLTNQTSIKEVILFPTLRPEA